MHLFDEEKNHQSHKNTSSASLLMDQSSSNVSSHLNNFYLSQPSLSPKPQKPFSGKWFFLFLFLLLSTSFYGYFHSQPQFKEASYWWKVLNPKLSYLLGSELNCKTVNWCGNFRICASYCETKDKRILIEHLQLWPDRGKVLISEWAFKSLPTKLSNAKQFPHIPLPMVFIEMQAGDLSLISRQVPFIDKLQFKRLSFFGQHWKVEGNLQNGKALILGKTGDSSNLKIVLNNYPLSLSAFNSMLSGEVVLKNKAFKKKNLIIVLKKFSFNKNTWKKQTLPLIKLNSTLIVNPDWKRLVGLKSFELITNDIRIYKEVKKSYFPFASISSISSPELVLKATQADKFKPFFSSINLPQGLTVNNIHGLISGKIVLNYTNLQKSKFFLLFQSLYFDLKEKNKSPFSSMGAFNGNITFHYNQLLDGMLNFQNLSLLPLQAFIDDTDLKLEKGLISGQIIFNKQKTLLKGDFQVHDLAFSDLTYGMKFFNGNGLFNLNKNNLQGKLKVSLNTLANQINSTWNYELLGKTGSIKLQSQNLNLNALHLVDKQVDLSGEVDDFLALISLKPQSTSLDTLSFKLGNVQLRLPKLQNKPLWFRKGRIELINSKRLNFNNLNIFLPGGEKVMLEGSIYLDPKLGLTENNFRLEGKTHLTTLFELFESLGYSPPWRRKIQNETGYLMGQVRIAHSKLQSLDLSFADLGGNYNGIKINQAKGSLNFNEGNFNIRSLSLNYGSQSNLNLSGSFKTLQNFFASSSTNDVCQSLASFDGEITGNIHLLDFIDEKTQSKFKFNIPEQANLPIKLALKPIGNNNVSFDLESTFQSLGSINSELVVSNVDNSPGYIKARGEINLQQNSFNLKALELLLNGFNLTAEAKGGLRDFDFKAYTDPILNLGRLFKSVKGVPVKGSINGWIEGKHINFFDKQTFLQNIKMLVWTEDLQSVSIGPAELSSVEGYFESKGGKGFSTLIVQKGKLKDLVFDELNGSFRLEGNKLEIPGLALNVANGEAVITGELDLLNGEGLFSGEAKQLQVGKVARGFAGQRGLSGIGDFSFSARGHLWSLIKGERPVFGSGTFQLKDGNTSQVLNLQKKLNLANFVFGGPLALNFNSFLEVLSPTERGFYKVLQGNWQINKDWIIIPEAQYRGVNQLNLNMSGSLNRKENQMNFNFIGSIPRIPVRVSSSGQASDALNIASQMNPINILGQLPLFDNLFDVRPRVFRFTMKGNIADQLSLNQSSSKTFTWMDSSLYKHLPMPTLPQKSLKSD